MALSLVVFIWGLQHRARIESSGEEVIRMLFVPSVEQGTLVRRGDELARFIRADSGLSIRSAVPTSYAAVIQALGTGQADVAWVPAFAYALANERYGVEARLQVVREVDLFAILVARGPRRTPRSASRSWPAAVSRSRRRCSGELRAAPARDASTAPPPAGSRCRPAATWTRCGCCWSSRGRSTPPPRRHVFSGPNDLVGDGRKELEASRPGTLRETHVIDTHRGAGGRADHGLLRLHPDPHRLRRATGSRT